MIVVAVIAIVSAMGLPNLLASKKSANETSAISYLRGIGAAQEAYRLRMGVYADGDETLVAAGFIAGQSTVLGQNIIRGYTFVVDAPSRFEWFGNARPTDRGTSGDRSFFIDTSGVLRWAATGVANVNSPPLE